jgi:hypothetical protein
MIQQLTFSGLNGSQLFLYKINLSGKSTPLVAVYNSMRKADLCTN